MGAQHFLTVVMVCSAGALFANCDYPTRDADPRCEHASVDRQSHQLHSDHEPWHIRNAGSIAHPRFTRLTSVRWLNDSLATAIDSRGFFHVHLLDVARQEVLQSFGKHGYEGASLAGPRWIAPVASADSMFWIYDGMTAHFVAFSIPTNDEEATLRRSVRLRTPFNLQSPVWVGDKIVSNTFAPDTLLVVLDAQGWHTRALLRTGPITRDSIDHRAGRSRLNRTRLAYDPQTKRIALAFQLVNRIDVLNADGCVLTTMHGPVDIEARYKVWRDSVRGKRFAYDSAVAFGYVGIDASADHLFALFCGDCIQTGTLASQVHVFSWTGVFEGAFQLEAGVYGIGVSPNGATLLGGTVEPASTVRIWHLLDQ